MNIVLTSVLTIVALWLGRPLLLPVITAVFLWYLTNAIAKYYREIIKSKTASELLAGSSLAGVLYFFVSQIQPMFSELYGRMPQITNGIEGILSDISKLLGIQITFTGLPTFQDIVTSVGTSLAGIGAAFGMIVIYMIFIFVEQNTFTNKISALFPDKKKLNKINFIIASIDAHMKKYIFVKTGIGLLIAVCSYIWLRIIGIDFASMWAFLAFVLSYIPTFGAILAVALPVVYMFALEGAVAPILALFLGLALFQILFGNILDPKLTGKTLNLSTLAILINLLFWGMIWGALGMFFSVPILVATFVISAQFDKTRWLAILLSADGQIPDKNEE